MKLRLPVAIHEFLAFCGVLVAAFFMHQQNIRNSLDVRFFYTAADAAAYFQALSGDESLRYFKKEYWDLLYIASYTTLFVAAAKRLRFRQYRAFFIVGTLDLIETLNIISFLKFSFAFISFDVLGIISCMKWLGAYLSLGLLFCLAANDLRKRMTSK